jgi:hypothetical protein
VLSCSGRFNILSHEIDCCAPILLAFTAPVASAAEFPQRPFEHKDREVACDNTRTCRAAGYASDKADNKASILLTRKAGPSQPVRTQLRLGETAPALPSTVQTHIDGHALGEVKIGNDAIGDLTAAQTASLLGALSTRPAQVGCEGQKLDDIGRGCECRAAQNGRIPGPYRYTGRARPQRHETGSDGSPTPAGARDHGWLGRECLG